LIKLTIVSHLVSERLLGDKNHFFSWQDQFDPTRVRTTFEAHKEMLRATQHRAAKGIDVDELTIFVKIYSSAITTNKHSSQEVTCLVSTHHHFLKIFPRASGVKHSIKRKIQVIKLTL
jgi:hypothetical protein